MADRLKSVPLYARYCTRIILRTKPRTGKYGRREYKSIGKTANFHENIDASFHNSTSPYEDTRRIDPLCVPLRFPDGLRPYAKSKDQIRRLSTKSSRFLHR